VPEPEEKNITITEKIYTELKIMAKNDKCSINKEVEHLIKLTKNKNHQKQQKNLYTNTKPTNHTQPIINKKDHNKPIEKIIKQQNHQTEFNNNPKQRTTDPLKTISEIDPLKLYDIVLSDTQNLDHTYGGNRTNKFIKKFGTRKEYAQKIGITVPDGILDATKTETTQ
jgi:predicted CopG family antitoxin